MTISVTASGSGADVSVTVAEGPEGPAPVSGRANGWVYLDGVRARAYVALWHPGDVGSGVWP